MSSLYNPHIASGTGIERYRGVRELAPAGIGRFKREWMARSAARYRLRTADGRYVHMTDFTVLTADQANAWIGFKQELETVLARFPELTKLSRVRVPPPAANVELNIRKRAR